MESLNQHQQSQRQQQKQQQQNKIHQEGLILTTIEEEGRQEMMPEFYYHALLNDEGEIETADKTKQFLVAKNSEIRFVLRRGTKVAYHPVLLINKPMYDTSTGEILYTVSQPMVPTGVDAELGEYRLIDYRESPVESKYLERVNPFNEVDTVNIEFRVRFPYSGSFFVQIEYSEEANKEVRNYTQPVYINVEPVISLRDEVLQCKSLSIITVLSRCLGPLSRWSEVLSNISQLEYNAVHYTPIQQYGESYSHYSLADQTLIDDYYFSASQKSLSREQRLQELKGVVDHAREEYGLLGIIDIVLNHTASNSPWLIDHPESAYNTDDCPNLFPAWLFDFELSRFSQDYADKRNMSDCPAAPFINNEGDLRAVLNAIQNKVINRLNLQEFFLFNVEREIQTARQALSSSDLQQRINEFQVKFEKRKWFQADHYSLLEDRFLVNLGHGPERHSVTLNYQKGAAAYFYLANGRNAERACQELRSLMQRHNQEWIIKVQGFMKEALQCIEGTLRYFKLELRDNKVTKENPLLRRYFSELNNPKQSKVAHNGWIMNADPMEDFAVKGWHYLRRTINIWSDSVKLRYGSCPSDSPYLWEHMSRYVTDLASIFDGFRLDNAHSTPIHVCYYLLQVARTTNPDLYVMAELFTSSALADAVFVQKLNINGLVREVQNTYDTKQLGDYFHQLTCQDAPLGKLDEEFQNIDGSKFKVLKPVKPSEILYDCTHDNPAPVEKFKTGRIALSHLGIIGMTNCAIASTWGYDQLIPKNLSVVIEKRLYSLPDQSDLFRPDGLDPHKRRLSKILERHGGIKPSLAHQSTKNNSPEWTPEEGGASSSHSSFAHEFEYEFVFYNDWAGSVSLAGEFNAWKPSISMRKEGKNKWVHKATLPIISGQSKYEFKFVVNGKDWQINTDLPQSRDKSGNVNNVVHMPGNVQITNSLNIQGESRPEPWNIKQSSQELTFQDIRYARRILNEIHYECTHNNAEIFLHQQSDQVLVVVRQLSLDHQNENCSFDKQAQEVEYDAYVSITRHPYFMEGGDYLYQTKIELPGFLTEVVMAGYLELNQNSFSPFYNDQKEVRSANGAFKVIKDLSKFCRIERQAEKDVLNFHQLPPSFTCILKTKQPNLQKEAAQHLSQLNKISSTQLAQQLFSTNPLSGFNHLLFRCKEEELDISNGARGPYGLQNYGQFKYAGLTSILHLLRQLKVNGDLGHELFQNVRSGNWLIDYTIDRLRFMGGHEELGRAIEFLNEFMNRVKVINTSYKPKYLTKVIEKMYNAALIEIFSNRVTDEFISGNQDLFTQRLGLSLIQMWGRVPSAYFSNHKDSMAAGLPHFTTGYMRCWGRDTFIALRGLLLAPGFQDEARETILYFAKTLRHGLIPNLHDRCNNTRYNARDATWFFIQGIKDYVELTQNSTKQFSGVNILDDEVELHFRDNNQQAHWEKLNRGEPPRKLTLGQLIHEILQAHASGIQFREWNAGDRIDSCMKDQGFNINIYLDEQTGFLLGGNQFNCGTWMDKMGSSDKTGNRGTPATPRDGAPIELVALLYSALEFMSQMHTDGNVATDRVRLKNGQEWTYKQWAQKIKASFEKHFWIPLTEQEDQHYVIEKRFVRRRGFYKDVLRSSQPHTDFQLRPNLCVALASSPDLFNTDHALICIQTVEKVLMEEGCMGIKTLDPQDPNYRGDYINSDDSQGWNYHQGPEWLWPVGFLLKAKIIFAQRSQRDNIDVEEITHQVMKWVVPHQKHIMVNEWEGLPELTNSHGKECKDSCTTQAWSVATLFDALRDLYYLRSKA